MKRLAKWLLVLLGAAVLAWVAVFVVTAVVTRRERNEAATRIAASEVEIVDAILSPTGNIEGRIRNLSKSFTLTYVRIKVTIFETFASGASEIVSEDEAVSQLSVPPFQARKLRAIGSFHELPAPKGEVHWYFKVIATAGEPTR